MKKSLNFVFISDFFLYLCPPKSHQMRHHTHIIIRILTVILLLTNVSGGGNLVYAWSGSGTSSEPYLIGSKADWDQFRNKLSANNSNKFNGEYLKLTADINIEGDITPTGSDFMGTFDGNGHTLKVNCSGTGRFIALFRGTYGATIKKLESGWLNYKSSDIK